jgi:tetratricopeptide (TPR) repeat protein
MFSRLTASAAIAVLAITGAGCANDETKKARHMVRGDEYATAGKLTEAAIEYENVLRIDPRMGEARKKLADVHLRAGDPTAAREEFSRAADLLPDDFETQVRAGGLRLLAGHFKEAQSLADRVLKRDPANVPALVLRANALAGVKDLSTAITMIEEAIRLDPDASELYSNLGSFQAHAGQMKDAEAAYQRAIAADPKSVTALAALANFYWATRRPAEAEATFRRALAADPANAIAHTAVATFLLATGRRREAEPHLKAVADATDAISPKIRLADYYLLIGRRAEGEALLNTIAATPAARPRARIRLAASAYTAGERELAHRILDDVLKDDPQNGQGQFLRARFLARELKTDEALEAARKATDAEPAMIQAHFLIGQLSVARRELDQAATSFKRVLELNPLASAANLELARLQLVYGSPDASVQFAEAAVKNAPADAAARSLLVRALIERRDLSRAEAELRPLKQEFPNAAPVRVLSGTLAYVKRDFAAAKRDFEDALRTKPESFDALSGLIGIDLALGRPADARARIEAELAKTPLRAPIILLAARTFGALRDLARAETLLRKAIETDPASLDGYGMLGQLYYEQGRLDEGRREFERLLAKQPNSVPGHTMLAIILRRQGQTDAAIERYRQALSIDSQAAVAANNLAWIYAEQGRFLDDALGLARTAKKLLPNVPEVADTLGWLYYLTNVPSLAVAYLQEGTAKSPENPLFRYHLGAALAKAGQADRARLELDRALAISTNFPGSDEARRILAGLR